MMGSSHRSPSPVTSRSNPNLPRSLQAHQNQPTRKSFSGANTLTRPSLLNHPKKFNFLTPANSPSEMGRRNFVGDEEKENEKEKVQFLKEKLRSPSKGSKNFMAPTISAASKFTPSPRKKILVERNDPVRTSIALSDGKATFFSSLATDFDQKLDFGPEEKNIEAVVDSSQQMKVVPEVPIVPKPLRKVTFKEVTCNPHDLAESCVEKVATDLDSEHNVSCPKVDVVETDFDESDLKDSCLCELSDNLSFLEGLEQSETVDSRERLEDVSFVEPLVSKSFPLSTTIEDSRERLKDGSYIEPLASESLPLSTPIDDEITHGSFVPKQKMKSHPRRSWKSVCLFLVLLGTLVLSATKLTTMHSLDPKDLNFEFSEWSGVAEIAKVNFDDYIGQVKQWSADSISYLYEILQPVLEVDKIGTSQFMNFEFFEWSGVAEIVKVNFNDFTGKVKQWSADSISYLYKMLLPVLEVDKMGPLQFMNLTILEDGCQIDGFSYFNSKNKGFEEFMGLELEEVEEEEGEDEMEEVNDQEIEEVEDATGQVEDALKEVEDEIAEVEDAMKEVEETYSNFDSTVNMVSAPEAPDTELKTDTSEDDHISDESDKSHKESETESSVASTKVGNEESLDTTNLKLHASEIENDGSAAETETLLKQSSTSKESKKMVDEQEIFLDVGFIDESSQTAEGLDSSSGVSRIMIVGISLVLFGFGTVAVMIYLNQLRKKSSICVDTSPVSTNKMTILQQEEPSTKEVIGESCASEMSSFQWRSSSYQKKKNTNRESLIYSSEYSFSSPTYGSFTTYETVPVKHGDGDEEIMTPVRRSSRIRKQVTSQ